MAEADPFPAPSYRQSTAPLYQQVIAGDPKPAHPVLREYSETDIECGSIPRLRYISPEFAKLEQDRMWTRVWQLACREEQIPEVGDCVVYESPGASFIVTRVAEDEIRAFYNSCLHRGMKLCTHDTSVEQFACPYHGFRWNIDGSLAHVPARWDFPDMDDQKMSLPQARVGRWQGFVFINRDPEGPSLEQYLGRLPSDFADWRYDDMYLATTIRKRIEANYKTCIEAFVEAFHVAHIHSQALAFGGDSSAQYDVWPNEPHVSRFCEPTGVAGDQYTRPINDQQILEAAVRVVFGADAEVPRLPEGMKARHFLAEAMRTATGEQNGRDYSHLSDAEAADAVQYSIFPNIVLFRSLGYPFTYRFLPVRGDPNATIFDFMVFVPKPTDGSPIPEARLVELGEKDTFSGCGVLPPWLGQIYDQDVDGLRQCQEGIRDGGDADIIYSRYQEVRIRHLHQTLGRYVSDDPKAAPFYG